MLPPTVSEYVTYTVYVLQKVNLILVFKILQNLLIFKFVFVNVDEVDVFTTSAPDFHSLVVIQYIHN